ncbi:BPSS1187 family protein [Chitinophaga sp. MM2321]|uniref:BPSS1187 family protein n=1 Tax=Chitinophaga sp. MM2321 TaxID=3137178 RepID=UPI0032D57C01
MLRNKLWLLLLCTSAATAQVKVQYIEPAQTQEGISAIHSPHIALQDPSQRDRHRLILMIPGTGGSAASSRMFDSCFATMGYHVISLDYKNNVITTVCSKSEDSTCFDHFREEIMFGTPVSDKVEVDTLNSIVNRFTRLLVYLSAHDPEGNWGQFIKHGQPRWDRIVAAGHSQGAGHAAYLGKSFRLSGVMLFSGPQDYLQAYQMPAGWQGESSRTSVTRYYSFLHIQDPFNYEYQVQDVALLSKVATTDTVMVQPHTPVVSKKRILVTDIDKQDRHSSTLGTEFTAVWRYMITGATGK